MRGCCRSASAIIIAWAILCAPSAVNAAAEPEEFLHRVEARYRELADDPNLARGRIKQFLKNPEFIDLSFADRAALTRALALHPLRPVQFNIAGTKLLIDDVALNLPKAIQIDVKDYFSSGSNLVYINGYALDLKFVRADVKSGETKIVEQLDAIQKFLSDRALQSVLPGLDSKQRQWADSLLRITIFPFSLFSGCDTTKLYSGPALIAGSIWQSVRRGPPRPPGFPGDADATKHH